MPPCLYCKREDRAFKSEEHVIPEGLGNREIVLPKGVVCDACNNGKLSALDQTLINFTPISATKTLMGVRSKTGALPSGRFGNASLEMFKPGNVLFESNNPKAFRVTPLNDGTDRVNINMQFRSNRPMGAKYCRRLTRALLKMLLGCICKDCIFEKLPRDFALSERFDPMRDKILDRTKFKGYFGMVRNVQDPGNQSTDLSYQFITDEDGEETVWVEFQFYGFTMFTDSEMLGLKRLKNAPEDQVGVFPF